MENRTYTLAPYTKYDLSDEHTVMLADANRGWAVMSKSDYQCLSESFVSHRQFHTTEGSEEDTALDNLFRSGLALKEGKYFTPSTKIFSETPSTLLLKLTGNCNFKCVYCYDYSSARQLQSLSLLRIKDIIDQILATEESLSVIFHGGEPLLAFAIIQEVVSYCERTYSAKKISFSLQTNGLLLDSDKIGFFEKYNISVGISLDGITHETDLLRQPRTHAATASQNFRQLLDQYPDFLRNRCGILSVISKVNIHHLVDFIIWLQDQGIGGISFTVLDPVGRAASRGKDLGVLPDEVTSLYGALLDRVRTGAISEIKLYNLTTYVDILSSFNSHHICYKGPCGAGGQFLVLDSNGMLRTCDCVLDDYFIISQELDAGLSEVSTSPARLRLKKRHQYLAHKGECARCPWLNLCGGSCAAKAIGLHKDPMRVYAMECKLAKFMFPELIREYSLDSGRPIFRYQTKHASKKRPGV